MKDSNLSDFESRFPSIEKTLSHINHLKSLNLNQFSIEELNEKIDDVFHMIPIGTSFIEKGTKIFRARKNKENEIFNNINQLGINNPKNVKEFGRANQPNEAILYCSSTVKLACGEVLQNIKPSIFNRKPVGQATVSVWEVTKRLHLAPIFYSKVVTDLRKDLEEYKEGNKKFLREKNILSYSTVEVSDLIMEFFCDEFSKAKIDYQDDYKYSVSYTNRIKQANSFIAPQHYDKKFDGIVYPSVAMKYDGENFALFDENLKDKIKFETAFQTICLDFEPNTADFKSYFTYEVESFNEQGVIIWSKEPWRPK